MEPLVNVNTLMGIALQGAFVVGCTAVVGKFLRNSEARDNLLPLTALLLGVFAMCYSDYQIGHLAVESLFKGVALGGTATGLYAVTTGDGKDGVVKVTDTSQ